MLVDFHGRNGIVRYVAAITCHLDHKGSRRETWLPSITFRRVLLLRLELIRLQALCGHLDSSHQSLYLLLSKTLLLRRPSMDIQLLFSFPLIASLSFLRQSKITLACPTT